MILQTTKDLARAMGRHPRTVKHWWKRLNVPPFIQGNACHRWTPRQVRTLLRRWQKHTEHVHQARRGGWTWRRKPITT